MWSRLASKRHSTRTSTSSSAARRIHVCLVFGFRVSGLTLLRAHVGMPPRRRKTLSSPSSTVDSMPLSTTEQSLRSTPATSEADSVKSTLRRPTRSRHSAKGPQKRARESSDEEDPLAMEEDEGEPIQKVAKRATKRRVTTHRAYVEIAIKRKPSVRSIAPCLPREILKQDADRC